MPRFALVVVVGLCVLGLAVAEDWTGKKIKAKEDVKPGKRDGSGLVRGGDVVKKGTELTVKADDGTFLEFDGKLGIIFKTEAVLVSSDPNALPSDGTTWKEGTAVFEREPYSFIPIERRWKDGLQTVEGAWVPEGTPTVVKDGNDGTVLLTDGVTETTVKKKNLMTLEDVPVWAERRLKANPNDSYALLKRSSAFIHQEQYDEALKDLTAMLKMDPTDSASQNRRGWVRMMLEDFDGAIRDFNEALRIDPSAEYAVANRGYCWLNVKDYAKADADFSECLKSNAERVDWLEHRAEARYHLGEWEQSLADAEAALKADPKRAEVVGAYKALSLFKLKKYQDAVDYLKKVIKDYNSVPVYVALAQLLSTCPDEKFRDPVLAIRLMRRTQESFEQAKREMPAEYLEVFAAVYAEGGEYELAIEKQTEAVKQLKADKKAPAAELKRAEAALDLYKKNKPLRDE